MLLILLLRCRREAKLFYFLFLANLATNYCKRSARSPTTSLLSTSFPTLLKAYALRSCSHLPIAFYKPVMDWIRLYWRRMLGL